MAVVTALLIIAMVTAPLIIAATAVTRALSVAMAAVASASHVVG